MKKSIVIFVLIALISSLILISEPTEAQNTKWTFMVYLDADNNLEDVGIDNFLAMAQVGSTDDVKIIVQFDRASGQDSRYGDWTSTKRFLVARDMVPSWDNALQDLGELNMADPTTLFNFVQWAVATYPADYYFLDLWDHGLGWQGVAIDDNPVPNDVLTAVELGSALEQIHSYIGRPLDILGNDACRMTLEIMYQARPYVDYFVGSEKDEPIDGWPYDRILAALVADSSITPVEFGSILVDEYVDHYRSGSSYSVTMALVDSNALPQLVSSLNSLVTSVNFSLPFFSKSVEVARNKTEHYEGNQCIIPQAGEDYDLYDIATQLTPQISSGRVIADALALQIAVEQAVIYEQHMNHTNPVNCVKAEKAHGLSLWYPWDIGVRFNDYKQLAFSQDSLWDEHLLTYRNSTNISINLTSSISGIDINSDGVVDTATLQFQASDFGTIIIDAFLNDAYFYSTSYDIIASIPYQKMITLPTAGTYDFFLLYRKSGGAFNASSFRDFLVEASIQIIGNVRGSFGEQLNGIQITILNTRTNGTVTATTSQGFYSVNVSYPSWLRIGDIIYVEAEKDGQTVRRQFTLYHGGQRMFWIDVFFETDGSGSSFDVFWPILLILIIILIIESIVLIMTVRKNKELRKIH